MTTHPAPYNADATQNFVAPLPTDRAAYLEAVEANAKRLVAAYRRADGKSVDRWLAALDRLMVREGETR